MITQQKKKVAVRILDFLNNCIEDGTVRVEDVRYLQTAMNWISEAFEMHPDDKRKLPGNHDLDSIIAESETLICQSDSYASTSTSRCCSASASHDISPARLTQKNYKVANPGSSEKNWNLPSSKRARLESSILPLSTQSRCMLEVIELGANSDETINEGQGRTSVTEVHGREPVIYPAFDHVHSEVKEQTSDDFSTENFVEQQSDARTSNSFSMDEISLNVCIDKSNTQSETRISEDQTFTAETTTEDRSSGKFNDALTNLEAQVQKSPDFSAVRNGSDHKCAATDFVVTSVKRRSSDTALFAGSASQKSESTFSIEQSTGRIPIVSDTAFGKSITRAFDEKLNVDCTVEKLATDPISNESDAERITHELSDDETVANSYAECSINVQHETLTDLEKQVARFKHEGNRLMMKGHFEKAILIYSKALELDCNSAVLYSNRSAAFCMAKRFNSAVDDARRAIGLDPSYSESYSRLGLAWFRLGKSKESMEAYSKGLEAEGATPSEAMKNGYEAAKRRFQLPPFVIPEFLSDDEGMMTVPRIIPENERLGPHNSHEENVRLILNGRVARNLLRNTTEAYRERLRDALAAGNIEGNFEFPCFPVFRMV